MTRSFMTGLAILAIACGGEQAASQASDTGAGAPEAQTSSEAKGASVDRTEMTSEESCEILSSGILGDVFDLSPESWSYRPASKYVPQALCTAIGTSQDGAKTYEVSLMVMKSKFATPADAVASLEGTVKSLQEGLTIEAGGKKHTKQVDFEPFLDDVGDKAAWAPELNELSVASDGTRFAITATGFGDGAENKARAIDLARVVADRL